MNDSTSLCASVSGAQVKSPSGLKSQWIKHIKEDELERLAKLEARIRMREKALSDMKAERAKIMRRCIRRERRAAGKE